MKRLAPGEEVVLARYYHHGKAGQPRKLLFVEGAARQRARMKVTTDGGAHLFWLGPAAALRLLAHIRKGTA